MEIFHSIIYGLISGISEFFPISPSAHQFLYSYLTGFSVTSSFLPLMCQLGCLFAVLFCCRTRLSHIRRELRLASLPKKRRKRMPDMQAVSDFRLVLTGLIPMIIGLLLQSKANAFFLSLPWIFVTLSVNCYFLYAGQFLYHEDRDSRNMNRLEGLLFGLCCGLSIIPGISKIALLCYFCRQRRCSREYSLELAFLFSIPMLLGSILMQIISFFSAGADLLSTAAVAGGFMAALAAFGCAIAGIRLMRYFAVKMGFYGFSHYCFGLAIFTFLYYLMT